LREHLAEHGIVIAYDSRPGSHDAALVMAATLHLHFGLVRTFFVSTACTHHFMSFYMQSFGQALGVLVTGGSTADKVNGLRFFDGSG
jgi:phosphomannomutase